MTGDTHKPDPEAGASGVETARAGQPILQQVLVASLVGAIILMIAIGAFWTSF